MAENSKIEWTDHTFNPWVGCTKISPACDHCYAEGWAKRTGGAALWQGERRRTSEANWRQPLKWDREAAASGIRREVFAASLADVFDNQVPEQWRADLWRLIDETPHLDWLLLTKRPQNAAAMITRARLALLGGRNIDTKHVSWAWPNIWLGTTVENQAEADRRIPHLLRVPAAVHFLSCEPLLGPVDLRGWLPGDSGCDGCDDDHSGGTMRCSREDIPRDEQCPDMRAVFTAIEGPLRDGAPAWVDNRRETIDWVIAGGESGPGARPMRPDWARGLRDQCAAAGVPFFFKQWGEHDAAGARLGKQRAGALLDGREHREMPNA